MNAGIMVLDALRVAGVACEGVATLEPGREAEPGWFVVTRPGGQRFRLDGVPGGQQALATSTVQGLDLSAGALQTAELTALRAAAAGFVDALDAQHKLDRAMLLVVLDENNALRQWIMAFKAAVAAAGTLAALKTSVAALPNLPDRDASQIRPAVKAKLNNGDADS